MKAFFSIFRLEIAHLTRSFALPLLAVAAVAWMFAVPQVITGDGTVDGAREVYLRYGLGGVFALTLVSLLASASGSFARERAEKRLQLTLVRPVPYALVAFAKCTALTFAGALVLALACVSSLAMPGSDAKRGCYHVLRPSLPSPREEARAMYDEYMKDPDTPEEVKKASKSTVLRLLEFRAVDHYQTIDTNKVVAWKFDLSSVGNLDGTISSSDGPAVRLRLSNMHDLREDVLGRLVIGGFFASVSNQTQSVLTFPLSRFAASDSSRRRDILTFSNLGEKPLMLRPRKDVSLLVPAGSYVYNLFRAWCELVSMLALVLASRGAKFFHGWLAKAAFFSVVAWAAGTPISANVFGRVTPGGLLANLLLLPAAGISVSVGALGVMASYISQKIGAHLNNLSALTTSAMSLLSSAVSSLPMSSYKTLPWNPLVCAIWYFALFALLAYLAQKKRHRCI
jgi:hypothetical protein